MKYQTAIITYFLLFIATVYANQYDTETPPEELQLHEKHPLITNGFNILSKLPLEVMTMIVDHLAFKDIRELALTGRKMRQLTHAATGGLTRKRFRHKYADNKMMEILKQKYIQAYKIFLEDLRYTEANWDETQVFDLNLFIETWDLDNPFKDRDNYRQLLIALRTNISTVMLRMEKKVIKSLIFPNVEPELLDGDNNWKKCGIGLRTSELDLLDMPACWWYDSPEVQLLRELKTLISHGHNNLPLPRLLVSQIKCQEHLRFLDLSFSALDLSAIEAMNLSSKTTLQTICIAGCTFRPKRSRCDVFDFAKFCSMMPAGLKTLDLNETEVCDNQNAFRSLKNSQEQRPGLSIFLDCDLLPTNEIA
jgi:hypothetical protein